MARQQKVKIKLPDWVDPNDYPAIADLIIDEIIVRTEQGVGVSHVNKDTGVGRPKQFPGYSDEYADSLDFKLAGKSKSEVDLTLTGEMLGSIELLSSNRRAKTITVGYQAGTEENAKAEGNQLGTYGKPKPDRKKARPFLGLTREQLAGVLDEFKKTV